MYFKHLNDISLHILDIVMNSVEAEADIIEITITEQGESVLFSVLDNGRGMDINTLRQAVNPGFTTKNNLGSGYGLSLLKFALAEQNAHLDIKSEQTKGTMVSASIKTNRIPLGDMAETMFVLLASVKAEFIYIHVLNDKWFEFNTADIKKRTGLVTFNNPEAAIWAKKYIEKCLLQIKQ